MKDELVLIKPSEAYIDEIHAYRQEFLDSGDHSYGDSGLCKFDNIAAWISQCHLMERKETVSNPDWVEADQFMLVRKGEPRALGMINFRHYLNDYLTEYGGHIGYGIRPSERRKGFAKAMLSLCLEECRKFGLNKVLITCDDDNEASKRTILACGGVFDRTTQEDGRVLERYWITLHKIILHPPTENELDYRIHLLADTDTMSYNAQWSADGTGRIFVTEEQTRDWYNRLSEMGMYYAYIMADGQPIGEVNIHKDGAIGVVVEAKYRGKGYGKQALEFLCSKAFCELKMDFLTDDFGADRNDAEQTFASVGFERIEPALVRLTRERYFHLKQKKYSIDKERPI